MQVTPIEIYLSGKDAADSLFASTVNQDAFFNPPPSA
jgi:hypothetical protein